MKPKLKRDKKGRFVKKVKRASTDDLLKRDAHRIGRQSIKEAIATSSALGKIDCPHEWPKNLHKSPSEPWSILPAAWILILMILAALLAVILLR